MSMCDHVHTSPVHCLHILVRMGEQDQFWLQKDHFWQLTLVQGATLGCQKVVFKLQSGVTNHWTEVDWTGLE